MVNNGGFWVVGPIRFLMALLMTAVIVFPLNPVFGGDAKEKKGWAFSVEPYVFLPSIKGDTSLRSLNNVDVDISIRDIFDNLKMAAMIHLESTYQNNWGIAFDFGLMDLENDIPGIVNGIFHTAGVKQTIIELLFFNRSTIKGGVFDVFLGARRWKNKIRLERSQGVLLPPIARQRDENWVDAVIGARAYFDIAEDWQVMVRGDIGGFGLSSDFTAKTAAGVMYHITDAIVIDIQYQALWVDYETGTRDTADYFAYDTVTHGPLIGLIFTF